MWNGGQGRNGDGSCENVTNAKKVYCITRKQDRCPNSGRLNLRTFADTLLPHR